MTYYQMGRRVVTNGTIIFQKSHKLVEFKTGRPFPKDFNPPLLTELDPEHLDGELPTFYESPALIASTPFYNDICEAGIDNVENIPVIISDINGRTIDNYILLNVIGRVSCANLDKSEYSTIGEDMNIIDKLVIDPKKASTLDLFLVHEDTDCIVISEHLHRHLSSKGYPDVYFEELEEIS